MEAENIEIPILRKGIVYRIDCCETGECYIGSSFKTIHRRMQNHECVNNSCISREIINRNNYVSAVICEVYVVDKLHLRQLEQLAMNAIPCINKRKAFRSEEQRKEQHRKDNHKYYENNKDKVKDKIKEYQQKNKDKIKEHKKEYRQKNKDKIKAHRLEKLLCDCGKTYTRMHFRRHERTKHHQAYLDTI